MNTEDALSMARSWAATIADSSPDHEATFYHMVRALLAHIDRQGQDIVAITEACQGLLRRNRELENELRRSQNISPSLDGGDRSKT